MNAWLTPLPPEEMNSAGVEGSARYLVPLTDTYEDEVMLSSGAVGSIAFELNRSDLTSPADEQAADGARPEIPQNDLVTTPSGRWNFEPAPINSG